MGAVLSRSQLAEAVGEASVAIAGSALWGGLDATEAIGNCSTWLVVLPSGTSAARSRRQEIQGHHDERADSLD